MLTTVKIQMHWEWPCTFGRIDSDSDLSFRPCDWHFIVLNIKYIGPYIVQVMEVRPLANLDRLHRCGRLAWIGWICEAVL